MIHTPEFAERRINFLVELTEILASTLDIEALLRSTVSAISKHFRCETRLVVDAPTVGLGFLCTPSGKLTVNPPTPTTEPEISVPIAFRNKHLGQLELRKLPETEISVFVADLGRRIGLATENLIAYRERAQVADAFQRSLVPPSIPQIDGLDIAAALLPLSALKAQLGGDFYDVFRAGRLTWGVVIGDVSGKGPQAAAVTSVARHAIKAIARGVRNPARVLQRLNDQLLEREDKRYLTAIYADIRPDKSPVAVRIAQAGHVPALLLRTGGEVEHVKTTGVALGLFEDAEFDVETIELLPGESLVLYTDGLTDVRPCSGPQLTGTRLENELREAAGLSAQAIVDKITRGLREVEERTDDVAIVVIKAR